MSTSELSIESLMRRALRDPGMLSLAAGFTDNDMLPRDEIGEVVRTLLGDPTAGREALQYGDPRGRSDLRRLVAERVRGLDDELDADPGSLDPDQVVITNGSQQALDLVVRATCAPGDAVLVESPTYFVFLDLVRTLGVEAIPLPSRDDRLDVDALPEFLERLGSRGDGERIRAAYVMGYYANPTGYSLEADAKSGLLAALSRAGLEIPVLEDAAYREFHFGSPCRVPSLLSFEGGGPQPRGDAVAGDGHGRGGGRGSRPEGPAPVLYTATFTKTFATGLKVGYLVVRDPELLARVRSLKRVADFGTSNFVQAVVARAVSAGHYDRFLRRMRSFYAAKGRILDRALEGAGLRDLGWSWESPEGGIFLWLKAPEGTRVGPGSTLYEACAEEKVMYVPGSLCYAGGREGRIRLSFGNLSREELEEAGRRFGRAAEGAAGADSTGR
ncbi:MAG: PLP-dependent aminotransferase family protein [Gemmatimonadota bacterium]